MNHVERLGTERGPEPGDEREDRRGTDPAEPYLPLSGDERRTQDPGVGGSPDEGQIDPVDGGPREDQAGD